MKKVLFLVLILVIIGVIFLLFKQASPKNLTNPKVQQVETKTNMQITSSTFTNNKAIPKKYTCDGENVNPELNFSDISKEAKSLVLIMDDPDAPAGTWTHWTLWNIDPKTTKIGERSIPSGATEGTTSFGKPGYGGPCPPSGTHRYFFKLFALDTILDLKSQADVSKLEKAIEGHRVGRAELVGLYSR